MFMSDSGIAFSKSIGWTKGADRTGRYAIVIDSGKVVYAENEPGGDVTVRLEEIQFVITAQELTLVRCLALRPYSQSSEAEDSGGSKDYLDRRRIADLGFGQLMNQRKLQILFRCDFLLN